MHVTKCIYGYECFISSKIMHSPLLTWRDCYQEKLKYQSRDMYNIRSGKMSSYVFETYNNYVMPQSSYVHKTAVDMPMCHFPFEQNALPHWKCALRCYEKIPSILIPSQ